MNQFAPHPMAWTDEPVPTTPFIGSAEADLTLLDLPAPVKRADLGALPDFGPENEMLARLLVEIRDLLAVHKAADPAIVLDVALLGERRLHLLDETLGEGEVSAVVAGACEYQVRETALPGVWRVRTNDPKTGARLADHLEIADVPSVVRAAAAAMRPAFDMPADWPEGTMNAPALLTEIAERMRSHDRALPNHVLSFTLLPVTPADMACLKGALGLGPVEIFSRGYGHARIASTGAKDVWSVQYLNAMSQPILDTIEIGGIPVSARAADEDFEDSASRLKEILEAYFP